MKLINVMATDISITSPNIPNNATNTNNANNSAMEYKSRVDKSIVLFLINIINLLIY